MNAQDFLLYCDQLVRASQTCTDRWHWVRGPKYAFICLEKTQAVRNSTQMCGAAEALPGLTELDVADDPGLATSREQQTERLLSLQYHVLYSESYEVPILLFNIYAEGGARLNLEEAWNVLRIGGSVPAHERYSAITMVHHPILFRPYLSLHPCKTAELIGSLGGSVNPVLSFLTTYGPYVNLEQEEVARVLQSNDEKETSNKCEQ
uniref:Ubiquitin-like-conjugating enzyme ATG10 n=1 Tax=Anopheles epiroticus TaxID=199890 RepID=A0A182PL48_9DIPT